jgi:hypothetical protein
MIKQEERHPKEYKWTLNLNLLHSWMIKYYNSR